MTMDGVMSIIISAAGAAGVIDRAHLGRGQTIVDIGLSPGPDGELLGDVDFDAAESLAAALTPKKGGVGAVTTAVQAPPPEASGRTASCFRIFPDKLPQARMVSSSPGSTTVHSLSPSSRSPQAVSSSA